MLNNKVSKAVRLALAFGTASTAAFSVNSYAAEEEAVEKVERIEGTGSRSNVLISKLQAQYKLQQLKKSK